MDINPEVNLPSEDRLEYRESSLNKLQEIFGNELDESDIEGFIGIYPVWRSDRLVWERQPSYIMDEIGLKIDKEKIDYFEAIPGNEEIFVQSLKARNKYGRLTATARTGPDTFYWLDEYVKEGEDAKLALIRPKDSYWEMRRSMVERLSNVAGREISHDEIIASWEKIAGMLDLDTFRDYRYLAALTRFGNSGMVWDPGKIRKTFEGFSTSEHDVNDNLLLGLAAGLRCPNIFGIIDFALEPRLMEERPEEVKQAARLYLPRMEQYAKDGNYYTTGKYAEATERRLGGLRAILK